jgi:arylsulfatase A-like enzyme
LGERDRGASLVGEAHAKLVVRPEARGGFSFWEGFESGFLLNDPWLHGSRLPQPTQFAGYQSDVLCGRAAEWISALPADRPCFAVVSLEAPHPPYDAPAGEAPARAPSDLELPLNVPRGGDCEAKARGELAGYYAHIEATDRAIGGLLAAVGNDAVVVFTSVHGDMHGAHGLFRKGWPHEESVRVPLLVRLPRQTTAAPSGRSSPELVSLVDLPRWTKTWATDGGLRLEPVAESQAISMPSVVAFPHQCDRVWRGVRTKTRKLVLHDDGSPWLLFDLENDPLELQNLALDPAWRSELVRLRARIG